MQNAEVQYMALRVRPVLLSPEPIGYYETHHRPLLPEVMNDRTIITLIGIP